MTRPHTPQPGELPSLGQLNRATLIALGAAAALLVTIVLPAEYGYDPTGVGGMLGLTEMGKVKQAEHRDEAPATKPALPVPATPEQAQASRPVGQPVTVSLTLKPNEGREVKATMKAEEALVYRWHTDGAEVRFELHGEEFGAPADQYSSYEKGTAAKADGSFRAPFDGTHGWYWRNRTDKPVTITVTATGEFSSFAAKP